MVETGFQSIFSNAAVPQKVVLIALLAAVPVVFFSILLALRDETKSGQWKRVISIVLIGGPTVGLLVGAMNSFHMALTIQRLPFDVTAKQLAPGILEVSTFVGLGAFVGLVAGAALLTLRCMPDRK
ncbi:hypothetical protein [Brevundimonas sp.]|uniref:hypothetical protein n=1 Tax=Brevundimonas sp. TaxID=1871086 RepID=UPI0028AAE948|nr:hypothetical protein [Brevundimonas sp.]